VQMGGSCAKPGREPKQRRDGMPEQTKAVPEPKQSCPFCDKKFDGLEGLAWHLNVDCPDFDETVNGLEL
jgi:hypothetical protein